MAKGMQWLAVAFGLLTALFIGFSFRFTWAMTWAITFGTCFYHFGMRLLAGHLINGRMRNRADYRKPWYQLHPFEMRFHKTFKVKKWKGSMPTYDPTVFDPKLHSWDEIAQAMCQAEIVHEVIIVLSFIPLFFAIPFGTFGVFLITSLLAACYDAAFVIMQRFNRPRILKLLEKERA